MWQQQDVSHLLITLLLLSHDIMWQQPDDVTSTHTFTCHIEHDTAVTSKYWPKLRSIGLVSDEGSDWKYCLNLLLHEQVGPQFQPGAGKQQEVAPHERHVVGVN